MSQLYRSRYDRKIAGVCAGMARTYGWDVTVVRLVWLLVGIFGLAVFGGLLAYVICWVVIPEEPVLLPYGAPPDMPVGPAPVPPPTSQPPYA